jgi:hypothetical protein
MRSPESFGSSGEGFAIVFTASAALLVSVSTERLTSLSLPYGESVRG